MIPLEKYYLKAGRASDLKSPKERAIYRFFEVLPGALAWGTFISAVLFSWLKPVFMAFFIIAFDLYWFVRAIHFSFHLVMSYRKMKKNLKINWLHRIANLRESAANFTNKPFIRGIDGKFAPLRDIYHLIILPLFKEGLNIMNSTFEAILESDYPKDKMIIVLAAEERAGKAAYEAARVIEKKFGYKFYKFLITVHPQDIVGERAGKGSNISWAGREVKGKIIDPLGLSYENIIVSCFDIDTQVFSQYFSCLTYHYLVCSKPTKSSFQPIPLYNNNIWQAPIFSRIVATSNVFWQMMQQERPEKLVTYSSHSMSFKALAEIDFWQTNVVSEDAGIFWKAYLFYDGDYQIVPLFYPLSMDACLDKNLWQTAVSQYKQQRRWAWGSEGIPYLLFGFLKNALSPGPKIPWRKKIRYSILLLGGFWAWAVTALMILFLGWLPLFFGGQEFNTTILSYNLPRLTSQIMTLAMIGIFISAVISGLLLPPRPTSLKKWRGLFIVFQWILLPFTLVIFGSFPALDAQTRLMMGKYMGYWVTPKSRG